MPLLWTGDLTVFQMFQKRVSFIINNYNFLEIEQFIDLAKELNATDIYYEFANEPWIKDNIFYDNKVSYNLFT